MHPVTCIRKLVACCRYACHPTCSSGLMLLCYGDAALYTVCKEPPVMLTFDDLGIPQDPPGYGHNLPGGRPIPFGYLPGIGSPAFLYHGLNISIPSEAPFSSPALQARSCFCCGYAALASEMWALLNPSNAIAYEQTGAHLRASPHHHADSALRGGTGTHYLHRGRSRKGSA